MLLTCPKYTKALDMWSVGCIFAELLGRKPIFPGKNYKDQIDKIVNVLGTPLQDDLGGVPDKTRQYLKGLRGEKKSLAEKYPEARPEAISLLEQLLYFDPNRRVTVEQALKSKWLESLHDENDEPSADGPMDFSWEDEVTGKPDSVMRERLKRMIYEEARVYHPGEPIWEDLVARVPPAPHPVAVARREHAPFRGRGVSD